MNRKKIPVTILIPSLNDEKIIKKVVSESLKNKQYIIHPLVVIDSKTYDNTAIIARKTGAKVVNIGKGLGKGTAIKKALPYIKDPYVIQIDSDCQFQPNEIPNMIEPLLKNYDVTLGTRYQKGANIEPGSVSLLKLLGSYFLSGITSIAAKQRITDVMAGFKGFKTPVLKDLNPQTDHFGYEAELVIKAAQKGYKIKNVPITYKKRNIGTSNVNSIKHGLLVLQTIVQTSLKK